MSGVASTHPFSLWFFSHCDSGNFSFLTWWFFIQINYHIGGKLVKFLPGQWLCEEFSDVLSSCEMLNFELPFFNSITEPEETYIHAFGTFGIYCVGGKSFCYRVIDHDGRRLLGISQFMQRVPELSCSLGVLECRSELSLRIWWHHAWNDFACAIDRSIKAIEEA